MKCANHTGRKRCSGRQARVAAAVVLLVCLTSVFIPSVAAAGPYAATFTVQQVFSSTGTLPQDGDVFRYLLTPAQASNPMPATGLAADDTFTITGTDDVPVTILYPDTGVYEYELCLVTAPGWGYALEEKVYTLRITVDDSQITVLAYTDGEGKRGEIRYEHTYAEPGAAPSDPALMVDPPVKKTVSGNPGTRRSFTFRLEADEASQPMPAGSVEGVKTISIRGSGTGEFGTWSYTQPGVYYYTIREVIPSGASGYIYDTEVYTITDTVREQDGQLVVSRVVTNRSNRPVRSCSFINRYTGTTGGVLVGPTPTPQPGEPKPEGLRPLGPKTGDELNSGFNTLLFVLGGMMVLGGALYLAVSRGYERNARQA